MSGAATNEADTAGARLARARARAGLTIDQVADKLRLDHSTIVALEADDHRAIGAAVFVRGFLRRFATLVGESPAEIEALYAQRPDAVLRPDLSRTGMHRIEPAAHGPKLGLVPAVVAALILGVAAAVWWAMRAKPRSYTMVSEVQTQAGGAALAPAPAVVPPVAPAVGKPAEAPAATVAESPAPPAIAAPRRELELVFSSECWAEVYDARGFRLFFGFGHAGTTQTLNGVPPFRFVLGNVAGVAVSLAGAGVSLPEAPAGERVRFTLDAAGNVAGVR